LYHDDRGKKAGSIHASEACSKLTYNHCFHFFRPIKGICGLTQETVVGLVANLESRELRRAEYQERGLPPEHPRSSATDDVEGIKALMHEMLGDIFDVKQFLDGQPKILSVFKKRIDPDLEFFLLDRSK